MTRFPICAFTVLLSCFSLTGLASAGPAAELSVADQIRAGDALLVSFRRVPRIR